MILAITASNLVSKVHVPWGATDDGESRLEGWRDVNAPRKPSMPRGTGDSLTRQLGYKYISRSSKTWPDHGTPEAREVRCRQRAEMGCAFISRLGDDLDIGGDSFACPSILVSPFCRRGFGKKEEGSMASYDNDGYDDDEAITLHWCILIESCMYTQCHF